MRKHELSESAGEEDMLCLCCYHLAIEPGSSQDDGVH
jgi:hypothetical protein